MNTILVIIGAVMILGMAGIWVLTYMVFRGIAFLPSGHCKVVSR